MIRRIGPIYHQVSFKHPPKVPLLYGFVVSPYRADHSPPEVRSSAPCSQSHASVSTPRLSTRDSSEDLVETPSLKREPETSLVIDFSHEALPILGHSGNQTVSYDQEKNSESNDKTFHP